MGNLTFACIVRTEKLAGPSKPGVNSCRIGKTKTSRASYEYCMWDNSRQGVEK